MISGDLIRRRARFYMCGPTDMMKHMTADLIALGVPPFEIFQERFMAPASVTAGKGRFTLHFADSGRTTVWTPQSGTILDCAERLGIDARSGCRVGQCESCAVQLITGSIQHLCETEGLETGTCLTCQAVPTSDVVLAI